jgi:hypothetical protein
MFNRNEILGSWAGYGRVWISIFVGKYFVEVVLSNAEQ